MRILIGRCQQGCLFLVPDAEPSKEFSRLASLSAQRTGHGNRKRPRSLQTHWSRKDPDPLLYEKHLTLPDFTPLTWLTCPKLPLFSCFVVPTPIPHAFRLFRWNPTSPQCGQQTLPRTANEVLYFSWTSRISPLMSFSTPRSRFLQFLPRFVRESRH